MPAKAMTGEELYRICKDNNKGEKEAAQTACTAYILGIIDYQTLLKSVDITPGINFCMPAQYSTTTLGKIFTNYIEKQPRHGPYLASAAVSLSLADVFPCQ